jgi:hypothetical protein
MLNQPTSQSVYNNSEQWLWTISVLGRKAVVLRSFCPMSTEGLFTGGEQETPGKRLTRRANNLQQVPYRTASGTLLANRYEVITDGRLSSFSTTDVVLYFSGGRSTTSKVCSSMLSESYILLVTSSVL